MEKVNNKLYYYVPQLGKVTAHLYPCALKCYDFLKEFHCIQIMKETDQLGVIRGIYEGAHHPRWEYVMVQLSLVDLLSQKDNEEHKNAKGLGLQTKILVHGHYVSGIDVIQLWILLFNAGHLHGTFATERAFLRCCKKHDDLRKNIYYGLPAIQDIRDEFKDICELDKTFAFHRILTCFNLEIHKKEATNIEFIEFLQRIICFYFKKFQNKKYKEKQKLYKNVFQRIRQLSYLFLDSQYTPFPINFDLSLIFLNFADYYNDLFKENDSTIIRTLESFGDLLSSNLYHSGESIRELGWHSKKIEELIDKEKNEHLNTVENIHNYLKNGQKLQPVRKDWGNAPNFYFLFEVDSSFDSLIKIFKSELSNLESTWNKKYHSLCLLTFQPGSNPKHMALTLAFLPTAQIQRRVKVVGEFLKSIIRLNFKIKADFHTKEEIKGNNDKLDLRIDSEFEKFYRELIIFILKFVTAAELSFGFKNEPQLKMSMLPVRGAKDGFKKIGKVLKDVNPSHPRNEEFTVFRAVLKNLNNRANMLLSLSRVDVYRENRDKLTDIDGLGLGFKGGNLGVLILEAKKVRQGGRSKRRQQLLKNLEQFKFRTSKDLKTEIQEVKNGTYCYLIIDGKSN